MLQMLMLNCCSLCHKGSIQTVTVVTICIVSSFKVVAVGSEPLTMGNAFGGLSAKLRGILGSSPPEQPKYQFPDNIEGFGYEFNDKGELVDKEGGRFQFVKEADNHLYNQQHYEALGELVTEYLYDRMEKELKLQRVFLPVNAKKEEPQTFIFMSEDACQKKDLFILIHGSGAVRAGQWSRRLIINVNVDTGSQFPYIRRAVADGYGVIVMNPNLNEATINGRLQKIKGNSSPEEHGIYVWQHIIRQAKAENIAIVAHSYGGIATCAIIENFLKDFEDRVFSIVFTDSVHPVKRNQLSSATKDFLKQRAVNFAAAYVPVNYMMTTDPDDCLSVSAGTEKHDLTSHSCFESAFQFIRENHATWVTGRTMASHPMFLPLPYDLSEYSPAKKWEEMLGAERAEKSDETQNTAGTTADEKTEEELQSDGQFSAVHASVQKTDGRSTIADATKTTESAAELEMKTGKATDLVEPETAEEAKQDEAESKASESGLNTASSTAAEKDEKEEVAHTHVKSEL